MPAHPTEFPKEFLGYWRIRMNPEKLLEILGICEKLKCNERHCYTSSGRVESVAEHSWRMGIMAMLVGSSFPEADIGKVIKMCLIHDLGEAFTGDIPTFLKTSGDSKKEDELLGDWIKTFPNEERKEWISLFEEMNNLETIESKIYKAIDKLEAVIQHNESDISTWLPLEYDLQYEYPRKSVEFSDYMKALKAEVDKVTTKKIETAGEDKK